MGLYIPHVKRPHLCENCYFSVTHGYVLRCVLDGTRLEFGIHRSDCPMREITVPHGDLIDRDALFKDLQAHEIPFNNDINSAMLVSPVLIDAEEM